MTKIEYSHPLSISDLASKKPEQSNFCRAENHSLLYAQEGQASFVDFYTTDICYDINDLKFPRKSELYSQFGTAPFLDSKISIFSEKKLWEVARIQYPVRAFFIRQKNSNSRLLITHDLLDALLDSNHVFDKFGEFVQSFGWKTRECDIGPPPCRFQVEEDSNGNPTFVDFECAYGLRYTERNNYGNGKDPWSVRQTAIYYQYKNGVETWVFISASTLFQEKVKEHIDHFKSRDPEKNNPFDLHLALINASLANWRWYIKSLVERATEQSTRVVAATVGRGRLPTIIDFEINFEDRQILKIVEDKALDLITVLDSTSDTIVSILQEYEYICCRSRNSRSNRVEMRLRDCLREVELYKSRVETLYKRIQGTASLLSDLLDHENAKTAQRNGESLTVLAKDSHEENSTMRLLTEKATKDAAAVKVITLITIIYLPTTVVSGFFSTQFVRQSEDGTNMTLTQNAWIIIVVALPLTIVTIVIWYCWVQFPWQRWWNRSPQHPLGITAVEKRQRHPGKTDIEQPNAPTGSALPDSRDECVQTHRRSLCYDNPSAPYL